MHPEDPERHSKIRKFIIAPLILLLIILVIAIGLMIRDQRRLTDPAFVEKLYRRGYLIQTINSDGSWTMSRTSSAGVSDRIRVSQWHASHARDIRMRPTATAASVTTCCPPCQMQANIATPPPSSSMPPPPPPPPLNATQQQNPSSSIPGQRRVSTWEDRRDVDTSRYSVRHQVYKLPN